jgi:hypothetical protein
MDMGVDRGHCHTSLGMGKWFINPLTDHVHVYNNNAFNIMIIIPDQSFS